MARDPANTKYGIVRKLPDIPRELPRHVDRATYPEGMLEVLP
jgi:hypothetical protein